MRPVRFALFAAAALAFSSLSPVLAPLPLFAQRTPLADLDAAPPIAQGAAPAERAAFAAADEALAAGLTSLAAGFYEKLAADNAAVPLVLARARLGLASCLLERGEPAAAEKILEALPASPSRDIRLALALLVRGRDASALLAKIQPASIAPAELPWLHAARGLAGLAAATPASLRDARAEFKRAIALSESASRRAQARHLRLFEWLAYVKAGPSPDAASLDILRDSIAHNANTPRAFQYAKLLAIALARLGKTAEAVNTLLRAPAYTALERDEANLLTGVILGGERADGRRALFAVLERKADAPPQSPALVTLLNTHSQIDLQRRQELVSITLAALVNAVREDAPADPANTAAATEIYDKLSAISTALGAAATDEMLFARARVMFAVGDYARASSAANDLVGRSPESPFLADALRILAAGSWRAGALRRTADYLAKLRDISPVGTSHDNLAFIAADCLFLAAQNLAAREDSGASAAFSAAAAAYATAQTAAKLPLLRGDALFMRVRCELLAGNTAAVRNLLATPAATGADDLSLLRCEWEFAEQLRRPAAGRAGNREASARLAALLVNRKNMPAVFRLRFLWQQALLALSAGNPAAAAAKAGEIETAATAIPDTLLPAARRDAVLARALLLRARAAIAARDSESATKLLQELRAKHGVGEAAAASYLVEGRSLAAAGLHERARKIFLDARAVLAGSRDPVLADYAAEALYEAAAQRVFLGQFPEAIEALENFANEYPAHSLAAAAKLRQADIFRRLNRFDDARAVYARLREKLPDSPDRRRAEMGLADCLFAKATASETPAATANAALEQAARAYEAIFALPALPAKAAASAHPAESARELNGMRAEAGYKWADTLARRLADPAVGVRSRDAILDEAAKACWQVISHLLKNPANSQRLGGASRYWLARCYDKLAALMVERGQPWQAARVCREAIEYCDKGALPHRSVFDATLAKLTPAN